MRRRRDHRYGQRWQAETVVSMIKRRQGGYVLGRSDAARGRELSLKVLTHNIMINRRREGFYRAFLTPFRAPFRARPAGPEPLFAAASRGEMNCATV